jgi:hypothetical protein
MIDALERAVQQARRDGTSDEPRVDWKAVDEKLFARVEEAQRAERSAIVPARGRAWIGAAAIALAACAALLVGPTRDARVLEADRATASPAQTAGLVRIEGEGEVFVSGRRAEVGAAVRLGDVVETGAARATLVRPGRLTVVVERASSAALARVEGTLVLSLARGAIEAQVVPVASGEALAIDVGPSRVAAHGTHFRVARSSGDRVEIDLSEGVLTVGDPPRIGSTLGSLVAAPAHAEFIASDPEGTLRVSHEIGALRPPAALGPPTLVDPPAQTAPAPQGPASAEGQGGLVPTASGGAPRAERKTPTSPVAPGAGLAGQEAPSDPNAQDAVATGVRACMAEGLHADEVTVVVSTTLTLQINEDGMVRSAHFEPPVAPGVNTCAAQWIYRARFPKAGALTIPISVKN